MQIENTYGIENWDGMTCIYDSEINKISECNVLHDTINTNKHTNI